MAWTRILCPVDFSDTSRAAMEEGRELARKAGAVLHLFHVVDRPAGSFRAETPGDPFQDYSAEAERSLAAWQRAAEAGGELGVTAEVVAGSGSTAEEIVGAAARGAFDLVVMGTHGRSGLRHLVLGSVAEEAVRRAPCPVLVWRPRAAAGSRS